MQETFSAEKKMNRAEFIVKRSLNALGEFLREQFGGECDIFQEAYEKFLENWDEVWRVSQKLLLEIPFTSDRNTTLLYVVEHYVPFYNESFRPHIEYLLSLRGDFWEQFYQNMVEAKNQITAT